MEYYVVGITPLLSATSLKNYRDFLMVLIFRFYAAKIPPPLAIAIYKRGLVGYEIMTKAEEALLRFLESE